MGSQIKAIIEGNVNFGYSLAGGEGLQTFEKKNIPANRPPRASKDIRCKAKSPEPSKFLKEISLIFSKKPKKFPTTQLNSPRGSSQGKKLIQKKQNIKKGSNDKNEKRPIVPHLRILRSRKKETDNPLPVRHISPKEIKSFVSNSNLSNSNLNEEQWTKIELEKSSTKQIQLKPGSEVVKIPVKKKAGNVREKSEAIKALVQMKKRRSTQKRPFSQAGDIKLLKPSQNKELQLSSRGESPLHKITEGIFNYPLSAASSPKLLRKKDEPKICSSKCIN